MAAALLAQQAARPRPVTSVGSELASELNPAVVRAMTEVGLDISAELPKPLTAGKIPAADIVITMGCGDACPVYPGERCLDWDLRDPAGSPSSRSGLYAMRSPRACVRWSMTCRDRARRDNFPAPFIHLLEFA